MLCKIAGMPFDPVACIVVLLTTFAVYSFDKVSGSIEDLLNTPDRAVLAKYPIKQLAAMSYLAAILVVALTDIWRIPGVLVIGLVGLVYTARIGGIRPKDIPGVKNLIVAISTAICYVDMINGALWLYALTFLLIFIDTVLFDLRDIKGDTAEGVRTLPVVLGRTRTLVILSAIDLIVYWLSPVVAMFGAIWILYFRKERPSLQYDLFVDAWMLWVLLLDELLDLLIR